MATLNKAIAPVPSSRDFLDVILNKTQRKTPTQIHHGMKIQRIRAFYMRKVKYTQQSFEEKLDGILREFPEIDNLHPFLGSLLNVLYDKNHFKLALGQLNKAKHLINAVGKDYVRLLKFGDSLYRCKQLKKAALGRMATIIRRHKDSLAYLEQVRQHMSRLPAIDPTTRTLLVCGYPNVGKSSFVNKVTRANVDVQPYAFTTKSLFVGHMDYNYLRWQVIDTPGVLDHPLDEMNTIEMQSITALAHLRSCVLYFMDVSEQCGYTVEAQCQLFSSLKPLFANKPTFIVVNKVDVLRPADLDPHKKAHLDALLADGSVQLVEQSVYSEEGVMNVRNTACDALLGQRVAGKEKSRRVNDVAQRLRVSMPTPRDNVKREPFIPEAVRNRIEASNRILEKDLVEQNGGPGVYTMDLKKGYNLKDPSWKYDIVPEIQNGKNIADYIDPNIDQRLAELEEEEKRYEESGLYDAVDADSDEEAIRNTASLIREKRAHLRHLSNRKSTQNREELPRTMRNRTLKDLVSGLSAAEVDPSSVEERGRRLIAEKKAKDAMRNDNDSDSYSDVDSDSDASGMDVDDSDNEGRKERKKNLATLISSRQPIHDRHHMGLATPAQAKKAKSLMSLVHRKRFGSARTAESDRMIGTKLPTHLFSGKRPLGTANHR